MEKANAGSTATCVLNSLMASGESVELEGHYSVECRDAVALLMKGLAVPPRAATRIENMRTGRQPGEKTLLERRHVDSLCIREESLGMGIVIGDGVDRWHRSAA